MKVNYLYWIWLNELKGVGTVIAKRLLEKFITPENIYNSTKTELRELGGIRGKLSESIVASQNLDNAKEILYNCEKQNINIAVLIKEYTNLPDDLIEKIAYTNLEIVGLPKNCANLYPSEISGGMKKRVAFARCLALQPKILFLDEPTSGLDPASTQMINELILYLRDTFDMTIVVITHDLETIKTVLDRFIILKRDIIFNGNITEAMNSDDDFIKDFLTNKKA